MMTELEERMKIESEWQAFGRDPERVKGNPNVRRDLKDSIIHRVFAEMKYEGGRCWFSLCGGWKIPSFGFVLTEESVTCRKCRRAWVWRLVKDEFTA